jgi:hypothetical protein
LCFPQPRPTSLLSLAKINNTSKHQHPESTMLPTVDESVLQGNPKFAALHTILKNDILNPSGSTKKHPAQKERDATSKVHTPFLVPFLSNSQVRLSKAHAHKHQSDISSADHSIP